MLDLVYADFLAADPTARCVALPNGIVLRSFSKSGGLAGLRVGYAVGPEPAVAAMRRAGGPYSVAGPSLALASAALALLSLLYLALSSKCLEIFGAGDAAPTGAPTSTAPGTARQRASRSRDTPTLGRP